MKNIKNNESKNLEISADIPQKKLEPHKFLWVFLSGFGSGLILLPVFLILVFGAIIWIEDVVTKPDISNKPSMENSIKSRWDCRNELERVTGVRLPDYIIDTVIVNYRIESVFWSDDISYTVHISFVSPFTREMLSVLKDNMKQHPLERNDAAYGWEELEDKTVKFTSEHPFSNGGCRNHYVTIDTVHGKAVIECVHISH